jgi:hypothetical protein
MDGLFGPKASLLIELRGPWEDDAADKSPSAVCDICGKKFAAAHRRAY